MTSDWPCLFFFYAEFIPHSAAERISFTRGLVLVEITICGMTKATWKGNDYLDYTSTSLLLLKDVRIETQTE